MMPRALMELGLVQALEDLLKISFEFSTIECEFEHQRVADQRFEDRVEITIYRVAQELINNVIKHAEASNVSVQLLFTGGKLIMFVEDDGKGLTETNGDGHGFLNIRSRLDMVKGRIAYEPGPEKGTVVTVTIPVM
jgi:signal transduction histidine kinase